MIKKLPLFIFTLIIASVAHAQSRDNPSWNMYTVKGERFSIALPALPTLQISREMEGQKPRRRYTIKCSVKGVFYTIQLVENPKPRISLDEFIQDQIAENSPGSLTFDRLITVDGSTGKAFVSPDRRSMAQFFVTGDRLYDIRAFGAPLDDPRIATFFHYLSLKKQKDALEISEDVQAGSIEIDDRIVSNKEVDTKVRLIKKPEPLYNERARNEQVTGVVVLKCVFAANGSITQIRVVQGLPFGLTERAIAAARLIKFIPATKDGKNVSTWMQLEYNFNLY